MITKIATAVEQSHNAKTGNVSATYAAQGSCPTTCTLRGAGCYAETERVGIATKQLNAAAGNASTLDIAIAEAAAIDALKGTRPLRLHVVGDCADDAAALIVSAAAARYSARSGQPVWTYTHAWRTVARESWGTVSVRASCETVAHLAEARARGYSGAIVVAEHASPKTIDGITPCPQQTKGTTCADCRLCFAERATIAFAAHGSKASTVRATLA